MNMTSGSKNTVVAVLLWLIAAAGGNAVPAAAAGPAAYRVDFVSSPASGSAMNDQGVVAGVQFALPPGCTPSTCLPVSQTVVWSAGNAVTALPLLPGFSTVTAVGINAGGWVAGYAGDPYTTARAVVWKPTDTGYTAIDLGVLPNTASSWTAGIDDLGRAVGFATTGGAIPTNTAPFVWSEATGMVDLAAQGFPNEAPLAISPGGTVATPGYWYRLGEPSSVTPLAPPPPGFAGPGSYPAAINDAGDQVRFQLSTSTEFFPYLFRYHAGAGTWRQIWFSPAGHLAPYGIGSINAAGDITATVSGVGLVAYGPDGLAEPLAGRLSQAYGASDVTTGGPINASGQILAQVMIGFSPRLVRLAAAQPCGARCIDVASIQIGGKMFSRPPGMCTAEAFNIVRAVLTVTDEAGKALPGATVTGRFLDQYYLDQPVTGTTGPNGLVRFTHKGPACVGAISILVDNVARTGRVLDFTTGELTDSVIPQP
jgi:hypothetical protein